MFRDLLIIQGLNNLYRSKDRGTQTFYCFVLAVWLLLLSFPMNPLLQRMMMAKFHLRFKFFPSWMVSQLIPSMYNFDNEVWISDQLFSKDSKTMNTSFPSGVTHLWVNHYPLRLIFFNLQRNRLRLQQKDIYIYLRSSYRDTSLYSVYRLFLQGNELRLEPMEND